MNCKKHNKTLFLTKGRQLICLECLPKIGKKDKPGAIWILHCAECGSALSGEEDGGGYCNECKFSPSMQDIEFRLFCPYCKEDSLFKKSPRNKNYECRKCGKKGISK